MHRYLFRPGAYETRPSIRSPIQTLSMTISTTPILFSPLPHQLQLSYFVHHVCFSCNKSQIETCNRTIIPKRHTTTFFPPEHFHHPIRLMLGDECTEDRSISISVQLPQRPYLSETTSSSSLPKLVMFPTVSDCASTAVNLESTSTIEDTSCKLTLNTIIHKHVKTTATPCMNLLASSGVGTNTTLQIPSHLPPAYFPTTTRSLWSL